MIRNIRHVGDADPSVLGSVVVPRPDAGIGGDLVDAWAYMLGASAFEMSGEVKFAVLEDPHRFEMVYGDRLVSLIPQQGAANLIALNVRKKGAAWSASDFHAVLNEDKARAMFGFLGGWLHGAHRNG